MNDLIELIKAVPALAKEVYSDLAGGTLREVSKIGVDAVKTFRLALLPLQYAAALQDRLAGYIDRAVRAIPEEQRISPQQSVALSICENLKLCDESEIISQLYVDLLSRAMDRDRVGEAHPAFVNIISQLAPDEILLIRDLGKAIQVDDTGSFKIYFRRFNAERTVLRKPESDAMIRSSLLPEGMKQIITSATVDPDALAQPELFGTFLEHLTSLGIVSYTNDSTHAGVLKGIRQDDTGAQMLCIQLSQFGRLFFKACVRDRESF